MASKRLKYVAIGQFAASDSVEVMIVGAQNTLKVVKLKAADRDRVHELERRRVRAYTMFTGDAQTDALQTELEEIWSQLEELLMLYTAPYTNIVWGDGKAEVVVDWDALDTDSKPNGDFGATVGSARVSIKQATPMVLDRNTPPFVTLYRKVRAGRGHRWAMVWEVVAKTALVDALTEPVTP